MIFAAINTLKMVKGSSRKLISEYILANYSDLPSNHLEVLTQNLCQLKTNGQLVFYRKLYMLPKPSEKAVVQALVAPYDENSDCHRGNLKKSQPSGVRSRRNVATRNTRVASSTVDRPSGRTTRVVSSTVGRPRGRTTRVVSSTVGRPRGRPRKLGPSESQNPTTLAIEVASPPQGVHGAKSSGRARTPEITVVPFAGEVSDVHPMLGGISDNLGDLAISRRERTPGRKSKVCIELQKANLNN